MGLIFDKEKCNGCGNCESACPFGLITIVDDKASIKLEGCNLCGACQDACAIEASGLKRRWHEALAGDEYHGIWVFTEQRNGEIKSVAYELLSKGRELADTLKTELCAVCFGHNIKGIEQLTAYGADKVYMIDDPVFTNQSEDPYVAELVRLVKLHKPEIVLAGHAVRPFIFPQSRRYFENRSDRRLHRAGHRYGKETIAPDTPDLWRQCHGDDYLSSKTTADVHRPSACF